jgi:hypothetical protein
VKLRMKLWCVECNCIIILEKAKESPRLIAPF